MTLAAAYDLVIFDLDGVVYLGTEAVAGAPEAIVAVSSAGSPVAYVTNNASRRGTDVGALLRSLGVPARDEDVLTSAQAAAELLAGDLPAGAAVLAVGAPALRAELANVGLTVVDRAESRPVAVVQGYGPEVGWADLAEACLAIRSGARWVATNTDATMPSPRGPLPGNGSLVAALSTALGGRAPDTVVGKPERALFDVAAKHRSASNPLVVGDRLDTDIEGAHRAGMASLLVLTGVSSPADLLAAAAHERPTYVAADCGALALPADTARVPAWQDGATAGTARVSYDAGWLVLAMSTVEMETAETKAVETEAMDALRALAAAAWANPEWTGIRPEGTAAEAALTALGLGRFAGWTVAASGAARATGASAASADR